MKTQQSHVQTYLFKTTIPELGGFANGASDKRTARGLRCKLLGAKDNASTHPRELPTPRLAPGPNRNMHEHILMDVMYPERRLTARRALSSERRAASPERRLAARRGGPAGWVRRTVELEVNVKVLLLDMLPMLEVPANSP